MLVIAVMAGAHAANQGRASLLVRDLGAKAIDVLRYTDVSSAKRESRFRRLLDDGFDLPFIGRFVLGRYWRKATPGQRVAFQRAFGQYVVKTYASRLGHFAGETLKVLSERVAGRKDVLVFARIDRPRGPPIKISWRVRTTGKRYRVIDVMVEGISMAVTQRSEFTAYIRRNGIENLVVRLARQAGGSR